MVMDIDMRHGSNIAVRCVCVLGGGVRVGVGLGARGIRVAGAFTNMDKLNVSISNYIHQNALDEITHPFPKFNSCTFEVCKWISNITPHTFRGLGLHTHAKIKVNPVCKVKYTESPAYGFSFLYQLYAMAA